MINIVKQRKKYRETAMKKHYETVRKRLWTSNEKILWNSTQSVVKQQWKNTMKQCGKACEPAMRKYYETAPKVLWNSANKNNSVKVDFIPPIRDYELGLCALSARSGGGGVGRVNKSAITEVFGCTNFFGSCFKLIKNKVKMLWFINR